jgi:hypothetical protein
MPDPPAPRAGDEVELRKPHACGANRWRIVRTGADLRVECMACGRSLLLSRDQFAKAVRKVLRTASSDDSVQPTP